jgi:hypothetical protein
VQQIAGAGAALRRQRVDAVLVGLLIRQRGAA